MELAQNWAQFLQVMDCADCGPGPVGELWEKGIGDDRVSVAVDPCSDHHRMFVEQGWVLCITDHPEQEDNPLSALEGLFRYADIDEVTEDPHDGSTYLAFTLRTNRRHYSAEGRDLEDALSIAEEMTRRDRTLDDLRREGLSDEDIDRLAADTGELVEEAWQRGFAAAMQEVERLNEEVAAAEAYAAWADGVRPFNQAPAVAMAADGVATGGTQPLTGTVVSEEELGITASIFADDVAQHIDPDKVGIPVILQVPARIVLS